MPYPTNLATFIVRWYDESDGYATNTNITADILSVPLFTDTGSGEVNEAKIIVSAKLGNHITSGTVFSQHDRIEINAVDLAGNTYDRFFEIDEMLPTQTKGEGSLLTLQCLGTEYHTQHINTSRAYWFAPPRQVASDIVNQYNENRASARQPILDYASTAYTTTLGIGNGLPQHTRGNYDFGLTEDTAYNRWMDILDTMLQSADAGGTNQPFELGFSAPSVQQLDIRLFESGVGPLTGTYTIADAVTATVSEKEGTIQNPEGTRVLAWGDADSGSLPIGHSVYKSYVYQFLYRPIWDSTASYATDSTILLTTEDVSNMGGTHWRALTSALGTTPSTSPSVWTRITMASEFGNTDSVSYTKYSPWTDDKARLWINSGGAPTYAVSSPSIGENGFTNGGVASYFDQNIIINTDDFFRTYADYRVTTTHASVDAQRRYSNLDFPVGMRLLVVGYGFFATGTTDLYGRQISNCVVEFIDPRHTPNFDDYNWMVKYSFNSDSNRSQVAVIDESAMWEWHSTGSTWVDKSTSDLCNDCFHQWYSVCNTDSVLITDFRPYQTSPSLFPELTTSTTAWTGNKNSAVQVEYNFGDMVNRATSPSAYLARGAWVCLSAPFPTSTYGGITEDVGDLYGGGTRNSATWSIDQPSLFDFSNMSWTFDGLQGFNQDESSESLGPINAIHFQIAVTMTNTSFLQIIFGNKLGGSMQFRCCCIDTADNVTVQDFEVANTDGTGQPVHLPISGFSTIKNHRPRWLEFASLDLASFITPKEQDVQNIFEWRNVKFIMVYMLSVYDEFGRYNPEGNLDNLNQTALQIAGGNIKLAIDDFHFVKPLLVNSHQTSSSVHNIEPDFIQSPNVILYHQLKNIAKAEEEKERFQHKEFDITTEGSSLFNIKFGDSLYFSDSHLVSDADNGANTIKLVAKRIEYSVTKPLSGVGGVRRRLVGVRRFT